MDERKIQKNRHAKMSDNTSSQTIPPFPPYLTIVDGFLQQVMSTPDSIAIFDGTEQTTYRMLEQQSRWLANALIARGIVRKDVVGLRLPRSRQAITAILGVLRASAAFLGLDDRHSPEQTAKAIDENGVKICITALGDKAKNFGIFGCTVSVETLLQEGEHLNLDLPTLDPSDPMYHVYTSGSTGVPKGIRSSHKSFCLHNFVSSQLFLPGEPISWAFATTIAFETAYRAFMALTTGGAIRTYQASGKMAGLSILEAIRDNKVDGIVLTPTQMRILLNENWNSSRLRVLVSAGEVLTTSLARQVQGVIGDQVALYNSYGVAESTMATTLHLFNPNTDKGLTVPVGKAFAGASVYVLNSRSLPVPTGSVGEIYIGGLRLTDGYINRPNLTKEKFGPNALDKNGMLYRTGDLGKWNASGQLEYCGRVSGQVKIGDVYINLSKIESLFTEHSDIDECAALVSDEDPKIIRAFYTSDKELNTNTVRHWLEARVNKILVPQTIVQVQSIPMSINGKVDRVSLVNQLRGARPALKHDTTDYVRPIGKTEITLAGIWDAFFKGSLVGRYDDFFSSGGDSLAFLQMVLLIEKKFDICIPTASLPQQVNLKNLAKVVDSIQLLNIENSPHPESTGSSQPVDLKIEFRHLPDQMLKITNSWKGEQVGKVFPVFAFNVGGKKPPIFWCFNSRNEAPAMAHQLGPDQPLYCFRSLEGIVKGREKREMHINLADVYAQEITRIQSSTGYVLGGNCQGGEIMAHVTKKLLNEERIVKNLVCLEYVPKEKIDVPVNLLWGRESEKYNPFFKSSNPELTWETLFPKVTWAIIPGDHGQYFTSQNVGQLCNHVAEAIAAFQ